MNTIKYHEDVRGMAINVKTYGMSVQFAHGGTEAQRERAWESTAAAWWNDADRIAIECGYSGGCDACGRSGGWCAPYDETVSDDTRSNGGRRVTYEEDASAPRFIAFAERIEALMREVPERFNRELSTIMIEDREALQEDKRAAELQAQRDAMPAKLADALRMMHAAPLPCNCGIQGCGKENCCETQRDAALTRARDTLAEYEALQSGETIEEHETMRALVVSTAHVTPQEAEAIQNGWDGGDHFSTPFIREYGFMLCVMGVGDEDEAERLAALQADESLSVPLRAVVAYAAKRGLQWIMFDQDAECVDGLPVHDWESVHVTQSHEVGDLLRLDDDYLAPVDDKPARFILVLDSTELRSLAQQYGERDCGEFTGALVDGRDGDMRELWATGWSRPFDNACVYTCVYKVGA